MSLNVDASAPTSSCGTGATCPVTGLLILRSWHAGIRPLSGGSGTRGPEDRSNFVSTLSTGPSWRKVIRRVTEVKQPDGSWQQLADEQTAGMSDQQVHRPLPGGKSTTRTTLFYEEEAKETASGVDSVNFSREVVQSVFVSLTSAEKVTESTG